MTREATLGGHSVLVIEDDYYLATDASHTLQAAGARIIGPCPTEEAALALLAKQTPDAAVLDINLGAGPSFQLASLLKDRGIPFVFLTGYDQAAIPVEFRDIERLEKPIELRRIVSAVARLLFHCVTNKAAQCR